MRAAGTLLALALLAGPAVAQPPPEETWLPERLDRALREMMEDMKPALDEALDYMRSFGAIDDPRHYEVPEILPNGDIIIRRRDDAPEFRPDGPERPPSPAEDPPAEPEDGVRI